MKLKAALYARVSTREKDKSVETQAMPLRAEAERLGFEVFKEYVDTASAQDIRGRTAWRELLDDAAKKKFRLVMVFRLDRAFRSVKHMHDTLSVWQALGIEFRSVRENFDTDTALGRLMMNLLASMAEFELELIRERVKAGMDRVAAKGTRSGRPIGRPWAKVPVEKLCDAYRRYRSVRAAARTVGCKPATAWDRLKDAGVLDELPPVNGSGRKLGNSA